MLIDLLTGTVFLGLLLFAVPVRRKWTVAMVLTTVAAVAACWEALTVLVSPGEAVFGCYPSLLFGTGIGVVDDLSAVFMLILSVAAVSVTLYARGYLAPYREKKTPVQFSLHYFALLLMYLSMLGVVIFRDAFRFLFAWELMTIASFLLILFDGERRKVRRVAVNYLILMHVGFIFLLAAFVTLTTCGLPATFDSLGEYFRIRPVVPLFLLFLAGFGMKAGMFPLHVWLPEAHPAAPSHVSAFMSGVMIKMGIYGLFRVVSFIETDLFPVGLILFTAGIVTGLWGVLQAAVQNDMKKLLAYSSIENIGIILIGFGAGVLGKAGGNSLLALCGLGGALLHTVNHSFFKTLLFLGTGNVYAATHTTAIDALGGVGKRMPVTGTVFLVAVLAICALPPLSGFVSEFLIYFGLFDAMAVEGSSTVISIFGILAMALIGGIVVLAFTKLYGVVFLGSPRTPAAGHAHEAGVPMLLGMVLPLSGILLVGLCPMLFFGGLFDTVAGTFGIANPSAVYNLFAGDLSRLACALVILAALVVVLWWVRRLAMRGRPVESSPTWGCGFTAPTARMQYSGESYSEGLQRISRRMTRDRKSAFSIGREEIFPAGHDFSVEHEDRIDSLFSAWWSQLVRQFNRRMNRLRTSRVNHYILYAILFFVLVLLLSLLNLI